MFGGRRIVRTMGQKITTLKPGGGFCAAMGGVITLCLATSLGGREPVPKNRRFIG
jgi:phosphate/sulfate permease